ncbi:GNAT family N-acetyltransferase [Nocardia crassostreae]|uniref:GNAT family N-acetyltransferase n=1 Tax=Nocardia crassostreae TaxID=53428 RepID=UPI000ACDF6F2|nr:GNAT family N-acetyltransferase [Nocardia crassostreae]
MADDFRIRDGVPGDADAVAAMHTASWRTAYAGMMPDDYLNGPLLEERLSLWRTRLTSGGGPGHLLIAETRSVMAGFVYLIPRPDGRVLIDNLHVEPTRKRSGLGGKLLRRAFDWAGATHPGSTVYLEVLAANLPAIAFYERHGGVRTAHRTAVFPQGFELEEFEYTWPEVARTAAPDGPPEASGERAR